MRAMILCAGKGERLRPLTDYTPKPLLTVKGHPLVVHHLCNLAKAGIREIVINLGHLGDRIESTLEDGAQYGVHIQYSKEDPILETGGGIVKALPLLGSDPFLVLSGDIYTDFPFERLPKHPKGLAHLVLTHNPSHNPRGDFALAGEFVQETGPNLFNFGGIGVYRQELFSGCKPENFRLPSLFKKPFSQYLITGELYAGIWHNIGTEAQLNHVNSHY